jgi:hypothetical protein
MIIFPALAGAFPDADVIILQVGKQIFVAGYRQTRP